MRSTRESESAAGFAPPPYPYERLHGAKAAATDRFEDRGGLVDCSIGTPNDPPPEDVIAELGRAVGARGYPTSQGSEDLRSSAAQWMNRRFDVDVRADQLAACVGTKEFVASLAGYLHLRSPERDTVLYPAISYPTYAMGATLAGLRHVAVRVAGSTLDLASIDPADAARALVVWSNSPSNPTGGLDDLAAVAQWGRDHDVLVASDECYAEFTWSGPARSIIQHGVEGVLAVHSISKRSNLAGVRVVPGASARRGSFLSPGVILMPSYVNIGAWVGPNTMVDTWATVGSCAQIGANVHLAGGVGIGGVLEPANATPVVIEDGAFIGSRCMVVEGARVGRNSVLGAGTILNPSIPVIDAQTGEEVSRGHVPDFCVAVSAQRRRDFPGGEFFLPCVLIIKRMDEGESHDKVALNALLREHGVAT